MSVQLTIKSPCRYFTLKQWESDVESDPEQRLELGTKVEYCGHIPGGMVKARHESKMIVIHPGATLELGK